MRKKWLLPFTLIFSIFVFIVATNMSFGSNAKIIDVELSELTPDAKRQVECLAENIYHEAGHEPEKGQVAVALVTMNRVADDRFPKSICGVVKQKTRMELLGDTKVVCQFSWYCMKVTLNRTSETYQKALKNALYVYANYDLLEDITNGSLYYHADYVNPRWRNVSKTVVIGRHIFYREGSHDDAKTKSTVERRKLKAFVFSTHGRDNTTDM